MVTRAKAYSTTIEMRNFDRTLLYDATIAAGDFQISKESGAFANLTNLPVNLAGTPMIRISLTAAETDCSDFIIRGLDQSDPKEWATLFDPYSTQGPVDVSDDSVEAIDAALLDAGDATDLIASIVTRIGNTNVDESVFVAAIRTELERSGGLIDQTKGAVDSLNDFDPANDPVARVNLVDTVTVNTDMRGTDSAATAADQVTAKTVIDDIAVEVAKVPRSNTAIDPTLGHVATPSNSQANGQIDVLITPKS